jgi:hypothetical protein
MFKALQKSSGEEIVILESRWRRQLGTLRLLDAQDDLVCQGCFQPVRVRAGDVKRWHFAHKHLQNCPYEFESPNLLQCRALLYEWLVGQRGEQVVTLEKKTSLPHPVDCWVNSTDGNIGYWIIDRRIPPEERHSLAAGSESICTHPVWVFTASMLHEESDRFGRLYLTTTEREFMRHTKYDESVQSTYALPGSSLHYINADSEVLITFRGLQIYHRPQLYTGDRHANPLSQVRMVPDTGGFVHPGEDELLERFHAAARAREQEQQKTEQRIHQKMEEFFGHIKVQSESSPRSVAEFQPRPESPGEVSLPKCVFCGRETDDYWYLNRVNNTCKCRDCYRQGIY